MDRTLYIYSRLAAGKPVSKQEMADRFGVSERTIQRDFREIREQLEKEQSRVLNSSSGASEDTICSLRKEYEEKHTEYAHEILRRITEV